MPVPQLISSPYCVRSSPLSNALRSARNRSRSDIRSGVASIVSCLWTKTLRPSRSTRGPRLSPMRHPTLPRICRPSDPGTRNAMQLSRRTPTALGKRSNVCSSNPAKYSRCSCSSGSMGNLPQRARSTQRSKKRSIPNSFALFASVAVSCFWLNAEC